MMDVHIVRAKHAVLWLRMSAVPNVGERLQIDRVDYRVTSRDWDVKCNGDGGVATWVTLGLSRIEE